MRGEFERKRGQGNLGIGSLSIEHGVYARLLGSSKLRITNYNSSRLLSCSYGLEPFSGWGERMKSVIRGNLWK